jgi:hypothetical protein
MGCPAPIVVRAKDKYGLYELIGEAYVQKYMNYEHIDKFPVVDITLT